ncbi:MAG: hypothetical protein QM730_17290 [Anaerolineales bacterium]
MIRCPNCNRSQPESVITCDCGFDLQTYTKKIEIAQKERAVVVRPYQWLPILLFVLRVMGVLSMVGGVFYAFSLISQERSGWMVVAAFFGGILAGIPYFALSEALTILLQMSEKQDKLMIAVNRIEKMR